jgi:hypothetical protein
MCLPNACIKIKWRKIIEPINPALAAALLYTDKYLLPNLIIYHLPL